MHVIRDLKTIMNGVGAWHEPELRELFFDYVNRFNEYKSYDLCELANFVVFEEDDVVEDLDSVLGFPIMTNRFDGSRYGEPGFSPSWEVIEEHVNWFELVYVISDDGFGLVVFVEKHSDPELLKMLNFYSNK